MADLTFGKKKRRVNYDLLREITVWVFQIAIVCFVAFVFVWYFGKRVSVVGDSMNPVLDNGDVTLVNRIAYNMSTPDRGDVIAFKPSGNEGSHYYIRRIIGLPGETVELKDGSVWINGEKLAEKYVTTDIENVGIVDEKMTLDNDEYFVLGDDRHYSEDSRSADVGNVKRTDIAGKVWFTVSPRRNIGFVR